MKQLAFLIFFGLILSCKQEYIPENKLKEDVVFLSDDKLEGRQIGTSGEKAAAEFIAKRFKALELNPKGTNDYFQTFTFKPKTDPHQQINYVVKEGDSSISGTNVLRIY